MKLKQVILVILLGLLFVGGGGNDVVGNANDTRLAALMDASFMAAHAALNNLPHPTPPQPPPKPDGDEPSDRDEAPPKPPPVDPEKSEPSKESDHQPGPQAAKPVAPGIYYQRRGLFRWR